MIQLELAWMVHGLCRVRPGDFDNDNDLPYPSREVRQTCDECPVKPECLADGLMNEYGIWGGTTGYQREQLRAKRDTRASCPVCSSQNIEREPGAEICMSCGTSWERKQKRAAS